MNERFQRVALALTLVGWAALGADPAGRAKAPSPSQNPESQQTPQPTFRGGINFVSVDVIVADRQGNPVTDLRQEDFEVTEDGKPQKIEAFKLVDVRSAATSGTPPPPIRTSSDEGTEAARDDVRLFAVFLDDYHVTRGASMRVREPLAAFVESQLQPADMIGVMYPLTPLDDVRLIRDRQSVASAIRQFDGRKYDYTPRNLFEEKYALVPAADAERIRNQVSLSALKGLIIHLGGLREGRKAVILVSEGFTNILPRQMQDPIASMPGLGTPNQPDPIGGRTSQEEAATFFANSDLQSDLSEVFKTANRYNTAIYAVDPRGLAASEFDLNRNVSFASDRETLGSTIDTLRTLAEQTDGRAIVSQNDLDKGLRQIVHDSSAYYLLGYGSPQAGSDGRFHEIKVRVKRPGVQVRSRRGYWSLTADEVARAVAPPKLGPPPAVEAALAAIGVSERRRLIRTWVGMAPGENGSTRVTFVWEPVPLPPGTRGETAARVSLVASGDARDPYFRGWIPEATPAAGAGPKRVVFDAAPGALELRLAIEDAKAQVLDREVREITVADLSASRTTMSTPEVFRARTAREWQLLAADGDAIPRPEREFRRTDRLLVRVGAWGGSSASSVTARLLNRSGQQMSVLSVSPSAIAGRTHHVDVPLASLAIGEYLIEITAQGDAGETTELFAFRVTG